MRTCTYTFTGNAAAAKKAERELSQNLGKENQEEAAPKKRKVNTSTLKEKRLPKTPSRKSNKKRKPLVTTQNVDFELGSPAPGLPPPSSTKTPSRKSSQESEPLETPKNTCFELASSALGLPPPLSANPIPPKADLDVSLSSDSSEELLPQDTMEKVCYVSTFFMCRCKCACDICMCAV